MNGKDIRRIAVSAVVTAVGAATGLALMVLSGKKMEHENGSKGNGNWADVSITEKESIINGNTGRNAGEGFYKTDAGSAKGI